MEIKPSVALYLRNLHLQCIVVHKIFLILYLLLSSVRILSENPRGGGNNICVGWECKSVGGFWILLNDWEKKHVYLLKWKQSLMTREMKYLDKTVMQPRGCYLVVLTKQRTSHWTHFCNFFSREFLKTVNAFDLSRIKPWGVRCCW